MIYITGPGHGGPGLVAGTYLEGTYSELYLHIMPDATGMGRLFNNREQLARVHQRRD